MSEVAVQARQLAVALLPKERGQAPPPLADVEAALATLRTLRAVDGYDETVLHETEVTVLRLRDAAWEAAQRR